MALLKTNRVESSRDTGVGTWVQELGMRPTISRPFPLCAYTCTIWSVEGLLHSRHVCLAESVDG
jgi:hypothetical protein